MLGKLSDSFRQIEGKLSPQIGLQDEDDVPLTVERPVVLQLHLGPTLNSRRLERLTWRAGVTWKCLASCFRVAFMRMHSFSITFLQYTFRSSLAAV